MVNIEISWLMHKNNDNLRNYMTIIPEKIDVTSVINNNAKRPDSMKRFELK
uniref:Uncharacterized protein n=1 Tax=Rhizophora mucronata TaxID=61149 RepID=A0A2P2QXU7_RHIMU